MACALGNAVEHTSFLEEKRLREINFASWCLISPQGLCLLFPFPLPFESYIQITTRVSIESNTSQYVFVKVQKTVWHYTCSIWCFEFSRTLLLQNQISSDKGKVRCSVRNVQVPGLTSLLYLYHFLYLFCNQEFFFFFFHIFFYIWSLENKQQLRNHCIWGKGLGDFSLKSLY